MPLSLPDIETHLKPLTDESNIAIALSGGGDSMALTHILVAWCRRHNIKLHILHVDHGLRAESAREAQMIKSWVTDYPGATFKILKWAHKTKPTKKIQEDARTARYKLLSSYCHRHKIRYLCVAHHNDDQAETILFRLAKGSGIDGLSAMQLFQPYDDTLTLVRPLLSTSHDDLITYCRKQKLNWIEDPSNQSPQFARVRLRQARDILAHEGLTNDRLTQFGKRCARAKSALQFYSDHMFDENLIKQTKSKFEFHLKPIQAAPDEIRIRLIARCINALYPKRAYPAPLERLEDIAASMNAKPTSKATLANCLITWSKGKDVLVIAKENAK